MAMYHSRYAELIANISSPCCQTDWDSVRSGEGLSGSCGCGSAKSPSARQWRPTFGLAAASPTAAAVPRSTHAKRNRVIALPLVGLGAHECLSDDPIARASKTRQNADEREATPGVGRLSLRPKPISRRPRRAFGAREDGAFAFPVRCEPCPLFSSERAHIRPVAALDGGSCDQATRGPHPYRWEPNDDCEGDDRVCGSQSSYARRSRAICALEPHRQPRRRVAAAVATAPRRESPSLRSSR
jgi:hypothetical protein